MYDVTIHHDHVVLVCDECRATARVRYEVVDPEPRTRDYPGCPGYVTTEIDAPVCEHYTRGDLEDRAESEVWDRLQEVARW